MDYVRLRSASETSGGAEVTRDAVGHEEPPGQSAGAADAAAVPGFTGALSLGRMRIIETGRLLIWEGWSPDAAGAALDQARNLADPPVARDHVALMPDAHAGFGMPSNPPFTDGAVVLYAVGVDIVYGLGLARTNRSGGSASRRRSCARSCARSPATCRLDWPLTTL